MNKKMVSIQQAADYLGCNPKTVRRRIADGTLRAYRMGPRLIRLDFDQLETALRRIPTA